jgi:uncharacterized protein (DUF1499 family)
VSTLAAGPARLDPIPFAGPADRARERLRRALAAQPGVRIVTDEAGYLAAEARSAVFGFVDDVELELVADGDRGGEIHFRSKSRVGYWDLGVNRRRMEQLREAFERTGS